MKRAIITLGAIVFLNSVAYAQYIPKIVPPSPNAASIAKFVESPVSYYRGSANVGIPLFSINTGDIPLNVSIQYDTKGVRVAEVASSLGAGWSLSAGGLITRQVRHRPDEYTRGYLTYSYNSDFETNTALRHQLGNENAGYGSSDTPVDEDPDLFFINFLGKSAKFIIDNVTKKAVAQSFDDWKIDIDYEDPNGGNYRISRIIITDELGNKYYFGKDSSAANSTYDTVTAVSSGLVIEAPKQQENGYRTAWHLKEVKTLKNSYLFNYNSEEVTTYSKTDIKKGDNIGDISLSTTITRQQVLQNISFPEGSLEFIYGTTEREDLKGGKALQSIILKNKRETQIKKIAFMQGYRQGDGNHNNIHPNVLSKDTKSDKRLFLNRVNELDRNDNIVSSYQLEYNPQELPNRFSNAIDYWGYFNGKPNKENIFTDVSDRDVYANFAEAGILTKITYPTGGSENFYYENNNVIVPKYFSDFMLSSPSMIMYDKKATAIAKGPEYFVLNNNTTSLGKYVKEFTIQSSYNKELVYIASLGQNCTSVETTDCKTKVRLYNTQTGATYIITQGQQTLVNPPLENGNYRIEVTNGSFTLSDSQNYETNPFSVSLQWKERKPTLPINSFVGAGRRIARIETNENGKIAKRKFTYTQDNGTSSGILLGTPDYMYIIKRFGNYPLLAGNRSDSMQPMSSFNNAGQVGYSQVTETFSSADDSVLWSKKYNFTNYLDGGEYYKYPYNLADDMDWARGLNLKTVSYDSNGKIVETLTNLYSFSGDDLPYRFYRKYDGTVATNTPRNGLMPMPPDVAPASYILSHEIKSIPIYKWGKYLDANNSDPVFDHDTYRTAFFYGGMIRNYKKIKQEYTNGLPSMTINIETTNASVSHHQPTSEKMTYSDQTVHETTYSYAHEKGSQKLINANMTGIPLETVMTKKMNSNDAGKTISRVETRYDDPVTLFPTSIISTGLQGGTATEVTYDKYDSKGNLQQYTTKDGISTVIIWGYNNTQPIAKIENAKLTDIQQSLITALISASDTDAAAVPNNDETALLNAFKNFKNSLSGYQITTYSYDPLIGVRSITPPSGITEYYLYDSANRLEKVVDVNGKVLKEMKYHYKN
ncbi:MAG: hypothetical protein MUW56_17415 [Chryseobacterium sp.]|uniref:hypothetical protein n=1 Tax=Chryseobacterium sp. TaxID=1871047 RepID=UPI0025C37E25|nr:hypothetical protein [Chryseobacterium sp.]MCJ7935351.1 hypothetical protein [Chryseobacterium sp.]